MRCSWLLYELLTGCTPFDGHRLRSAAFDEMLRIVREEDPPKPSTCLSSAQTLPSIAASRSVEPARLSRIDLLSRHYERFSLGSQTKIKPCLTLISKRRDRRLKRRCSEQSTSRLS
jgi:hypothetical protein